MKLILIHFLGYFVSALGAVVGVSLLTRYVSPEQYGQVALYVAFATLFQYLVRESWGNNILRNSFYLKAGGAYGVVLDKKAFKLLFASFLVLALGAWFWVSARDGLGEFISGMAFVSLLGAAVIGESALSATSQRTGFALHCNFLQWLRFGFALLFFVFIDQSVTAIMAGFAIGVACTVIFDVLFLSSISSKTEKVTNLGGNEGAELEAVKPLPIGKCLLIGFLLWVISFYDRLALEWFVGLEVLGAYFVLYQLGFMPVVLVMRALFQYIMPVLFKSNDSAGIVQRNGRVVLAFLAPGLCGVGAVWILHEWIFSWMVGDAYRQYSWLLPWVVLGAVGYSVSYLLQAGFYANAKMEKLVWIKLASASLCIGLVTIGAVYGEIMGVVGANVVVSLVGAGVASFALSAGESHTKAPNEPN
ncbi:lipopolysaccharide biosynthesis protein [Aestuariirhabdus sp. LZHN29]|uniref:lipopolysaccharide biosynthesis protein n=1 Tax=Aestuariirhabdus sp. LZHN29 TaxID=3417462 RepID=UPI003CEB3C7E